MRILWLDEACRHDRYDDWLHWKFAKAIKPYADIFFYAPFIHEKEPSFTPIPYEKNLLLEDIVSELKIDCVIMDTKGGAYHNYLPDLLYHDKHSGSIFWLPKDFKTCKVKKICIEEDFQYETSYDWHENLGFELILQHHYVHVSKIPTSIPVKYFPFSVDSTVFFDRGNPRNEKVGFAGTQKAGNAMQGGSVYLPRETAYDKLFSQGFLADISTPAGQRIEGQNYVDYLQKNIAYLSCGSVYNLTPAKMFEIMASGGVLFTNKTIGLEELFPEGSYETYDKTCSDLIDKVKNIIDNKEYREQMVKKAKECISNCHTYEIRIKELLNHIEKL